MAPVSHWSEADYYTARDRARAAWEASEPQLVIVLDPDYATDANLMPWPGVPRENLGEWPDFGLEGADAGTTSLVASAPSSPTGWQEEVGQAEAAGRNSSSGAPVSEPPPASPTGPTTTTREN